MLRICWNTARCHQTSSVYITGTNYLYEVTDEELVQKAELPYKYEPTDMLALGKEIYGVSGSFGRIDRFSEDGEVQEGIAAASNEQRSCVLQQKLSISFT